jgi:hypothetical protein
MADVHGLGAAIPLDPSLSYDIEEDETMGGAQFLATAVLDRKDAYCQATYRTWQFTIDRPARIFWCGSQEERSNEGSGYEDVAAGTLRVKLPPKDLIAEEEPPHLGKRIAPISEKEPGTFKYQERFNYYHIDGFALFFLVLPPNHLPRANEFEPIPDNGWPHKDRFVLIWFRKPDTDFSVTFQEVSPHIFAARALDCSSDIQKLPKETDEMPSRLSARVGKEGSSVASILFLAADPTDASRLRLGEEFREIQERLRMSQLREQFDLESRLSVRPTDIAQALLDVQPEIVHFSCHGTANGALCFENQIGEAHPIQPDALAALFEQFTIRVSCVILNACYTEIQAAAIAKHIDYVIGMNQAIGDKAAIAFTVGFYQALGAGRTIEEAYKLGCVQIRLQGIPEHLTPVLIKKGQT